MSNTQCKDPSVTWYNNQDGLNPCEQYSALRKICDTGYEVPVLTPNTPPDYCQSQNKACCCNSVSFALSMLCLQCQQGVGTGRPGDNGIDAGKGAYQMYLSGCGAGTNQSLPEIVQTAVCRTGLKLMAYQYNLFWGTGDWFLEFTRQTANLETAAGELDPGKCPAESSTTPPPTVAQSTGTIPHSATTTNSQDQSPGTSDTSNGGSHSNAALIGGSVGAAIAIVILIGLIAFMLWRRRKEEDQMRERPNMAAVPFCHSTGTGFGGSSNHAIAPNSYSGVRPYTEYSDQPSIVGSSITGSGAAPVTAYPQHTQSGFSPNSYAAAGGAYQQQQYQQPYAAARGQEGDPFSGGVPMAAVAAQPMTAHDRKMASANGSGARVNRDPRSSISSPVVVTSTTSPLDLTGDTRSDLVRSNTRATMSRPPEYPFDELPHRESMGFAVSSHEPSEGPRTRYAPTDFDADEASAYGGVARSGRSTSPPASDFRR